jgi:hypothetical protein
VTRAVFKIISDHVSQGEINDVRTILPPEAAELAAPRIRGFFTLPSLHER